VLRVLATVSWNLHTDLAKSLYTVPTGYKAAIFAAAIQGTDWSALFTTEVLTIKYESSGILPELALGDLSPSGVYSVYLQNTFPGSVAYLDAADIAIGVIDGLASANCPTTVQVLGWLTPV
jgi:hypothetical protein